MFLILIAHHGVAVDDIRFDTCRTMATSANCFSAAPNMVRNAGRILSAYTKVVSVGMYTLMSLLTSKNFHKEWIIYGESQENGVWIICQHFCNYCNRIICILPIKWYL